jgi:hypothetical protein
MLILLDSKLTLVQFIDYYKMLENMAIELNIVSRAAQSGLGSRIWLKSHSLATTAI